MVRTKTSYAILKISFVYCRFNNIHAILIFIEVADKIAPPIKLSKKYKFSLVLYADF